MQSQYIVCVEFCQILHTHYHPNKNEMCYFCESYYHHPKNIIILLCIGQPKNKITSQNFPLPLKNLERLQLSGLLVLKFHLLISQTLETELATSLFTYDYLYILSIC